MKILHFSILSIVAMLTVLITSLIQTEQLAASQVGGKILPYQRSVAVAPPGTMSLSRRVDAHAGRQTSTKSDQTTSKQPNLALQAAAKGKQGAVERSLKVADTAAPARFTPRSPVRPNVIYVPQF